MEDPEEKKKKEEKDTIICWWRLLGYNTLWFVGMDHAGIAAQLAVEKKIMTERRLTRHDLGWESFVSEVWRWKDEHGGSILKQLRHLGASLDWPREVLPEKDDPPAGCSVSIVNKNLSIYLKLRGNIDVETERGKLKRTKEELQSYRSYHKNVSHSIREKDRDEPDSRATCEDRKWLT